MNDERRVHLDHLYRVAVRRLIRSSGARLAQRALRRTGACEQGDGPTMADLLAVLALFHGVLLEAEARLRTPTQSRTPVKSQAQSVTAVALRHVK